MHTDCWVDLTYKKKEDGYVRLRCGKGRRIYAHRLSYSVLVGNVTAGLQLDHLCRNRACYNPKHLEPVTPQENTLRGESGLSQKLKTHCKRGHAYKGDNLYVTSQGHRQCKSCNRITRQKRKEVRYGPN